MHKIFLVGYMGSGKTTIGRRLAKELDLQFVDLDLFIENRYHKKVRDIFQEAGEEEFRKIEEEILKEVSCFENVIIATGGGTPCFFDNMELMNQLGKTVYLKTSVTDLAKRLMQGKENRPLIKDKTSEELLEFIHESLEKRKIHYNKSSLIFDFDKLEDKDDIDLIVEELKTYLNQ